MSYSVVLFRRAKDDIRSILRWLGRKSPQGMARWRNALYTAFDQIAADPSACSPVAEGNRLPEGLRQRLFSTRHGNVYRIVFVVQSEEVWILRVRSPGQRPLRNKDIRG